MWLQEFAINWHLKLDPAGLYAFAGFWFLLTCAASRWLAAYHLSGEIGPHSMWTKGKLRMLLLFLSSWHEALESWKLGEGHKINTA